MRTEHTRRSFLGALGCLSAAPLVVSLPWLAGAEPWTVGPEYRMISGHHWEICRTLHFSTLKVGFNGNYLCGNTGISQLVPSAYSGCAACKRCGFTMPYSMDDTISRERWDGTTVWTPRMTPHSAGLDRCGGRA